MPADPGLPTDPTLIDCLLRAEAVAVPSFGLRFLDRRERPTWYDWPTTVARVRRAAGALYQAGVRPGDRVALIMPTAVEFTDALFGAQWLGAVPVPLYPPVRLGRLDAFHDRTLAMLAAVEARILVADRQVRRILGQVARRAQLPLGVLAAETLHQGPARPAQAVLPDALAMVQFSSGTTVDPKPVGLSHRQVIAQLRCLEHYFPRDPDDLMAHTDVGVCWLPLYHDMGLIGHLFLTAYGPGPLTLISPENFLARPASWLRAISTYRGTASAAPDFAFALCAERIKDRELEGLDLSCWRLAMNGAEPISPRSLRAFQDRFGPVGFRPEAMTPVYGMSEAALAVSFSAPDQAWSSRVFDRAALAAGAGASGLAAGPQGTEVVSVGRAVPGFEIQARAPDGRVLPDGRVGEIWTRGPSLTSGYIGRDDLPLDGQGWLNTGDLGLLEDGQLYITGRAKDVIVLKGQNHAPHDFEAAASQVAAVRTGCVVAAGLQVDAGEQLLLLAECKQPTAETADQVIAAVRRDTGIAPGLVVLLAPGTLPRTSSGKLRRSVALGQYLAGTLTPPDKVGAVLLAGALAKSAMGYLQARGTPRS